MDQDGQLTFDDDPKAVKMRTANNYLKLGEFDKAAHLFHEILDSNKNLEYPGLLTGIRASEFWNNRQEQITSMETGLDKGKFLVSEWNKFESFLQDKNIFTESPIEAIRKYIFTEAIRCFTKAYQNTVSPDISLLYDIGECFFNVNDFKKAVETFEFAWSFHRENSKIIARLADSYYSLGDVSRARLLFREMFLYKPEQIELDRIRASIIVDIIYDIRQQGYDDSEIVFWIPIFAAINHQFHIKRELDDNEVNILSENVYQLEKELSSNGVNARELMPVLLNKYLWLIDHYLIEKSDAIKVDILKKKFQETDSETFTKIFRTEKGI
ncbi:MAG: tetratricopeptide repeat protein [Spirochaetes bacterium]|nr:tetratricopeptide repeat protein [Spirochaetota bacterium]